MHGKEVSLVEAHPRPAIAQVSWMHPQHLHRLLPLPRQWLHSQSHNPPPLQQLPTRHLLQPPLQQLPTRLHLRPLLQHNMVHLNRQRPAPQRHHFADPRRLRLQLLNARHLHLRWHLSARLLPITSRVSQRRRSQLLSRSNHTLLSQTHPRLLLLQLTLRRLQ